MIVPPKGSNPTTDRTVFIRGATKLEMNQINEYKVFQDHGKPNMISNRERYQMPNMDTRKFGFSSSLLSNMMADRRLD